MRSVLSVLFGLLAFGLAGSAQTTAGQSLRLEDDRGQTIDEPLSVCFQIALASQCSEVRPGEAVALPASFAGVRAEGAHHGPVSVLDRELRPAGNGGPQVLRVPRKALLQVEKLPSDPLTVSAFRQRAASFRNPIFNGVVGPAGVEVPAGDLVLALAARGGAPDLQRLTAPPGSRVTVTYHPRDGWSLLVRCREVAGGDGGAPVPGAAVSVAGRTEKTGGDGLALLAGLRTAEAVEVRHAAYLPQELAPPPAEPGAFLVHEVLLEHGSTVTARVTLNGRPAAGTYCKVLTEPRSGGGTAKLAEGIANPEGLYRSGRLPAGSYVLRVTVAQNQSSTDQPFTVRDGEDARLEVALGSIRVSGRVVRGGSPAAGYTVEASIETDKPETDKPEKPEMKKPGTKPDGQADSRRPPVFQVTTNTEGEYKATLWAPGDYVLHLRTETGTPMSVERRVSLVKPEETVDFDLDGATLSGRVVDDEGSPVEAAKVTLARPQGPLTVLTDKSGTFEVLAPEDGTGVLFAEKAGFLPSPPHRLFVNRDDDPGELTLVLQRK